MDIEYNAEDPNQSLKAIFKLVKERVQPLIDYDNNEPIKKKIDVAELDLQSPYHEVSRSVNKRLNFLLDLVPSITYYR